MRGMTKTFYQQSRNRIPYSRGIGSCISRFLKNDRGPVKTVDQLYQEIEEKVQRDAENRRRRRLFHRPFKSSTLKPNYPRSPANRLHQSPHLTSSGLKGYYWDDDDDSDGGCD